LIDAAQIISIFIFMSSLLLTAILVIAHRSTAT